MHMHMHAYAYMHMRAPRGWFCARVRERAQAIQSYDQALAHSPDDEALRLSRRQASFALAIEP